MIVGIIKLPWYHYLQRFLVFVARYVFAFYYRNDYEPIPRIKEPLLKESAMSLALKIRTKEIKSEDLIKLFVKRIKEVNPILKCFVEDRFEAALEEARNADELIRSGKLSEGQLIEEKPLLGVPFTTKDCIAIKGLHQTAGLINRKNKIADEDALVISYLRKAGAIPIGLTNVSELCMWWESNNNLYGRSRNAFDTRRGAGGSSGGEGCIQTICGSAFGVGNDIGGSIRIPAMFNGIFGHKPSKFVVSNDGEFPPINDQYRSSFLGTGPMCKRATDLKPLLHIMSGENSAKLKLDEKVDLRKLKVYYQFENSNALMVCNVEQEIKKLLSNAVLHLNNICQVPAKEVKIQKLKNSSDIWQANMKSKDSISFIELLTGSKDRNCLYFELLKSLVGKAKYTVVSILTILRSGSKSRSSSHGRMKILRQELEDEFKDFLKDDGVFLYPTHPTAVPYHNEAIVRFQNFSYTGIINTLGFPATHIPMGLNKEGLPIGIQVISNHNNDRLCLAVVEDFEKTFGGWIEPGIDINTFRE